MDINIKPKENLLFNAYNLFFIISAIQISVGLTNFSRDVYKEAKHDGWISVLIAGIGAYTVTLVIIKTMELYQSADLYGIHEDVFGRIIGKFISLLFVANYLGATIIIINAYIEIIQAWLFPEIPTWLFVLIGLILILYGAFGGLRVIIGISVFSFFSTIWLIFLLYYPLQFAEWSSLFPIMDTSIKNLLNGAHKMTFSMTGFEIIYFIYPYIKEKKKTLKYSFLGLAFTVFLYTALMMVAIVFYSEDQLMTHIWPTLSFFKIVHFPFMERFEIIAVSIWILFILPTVLFLLWASSKGMKRMFKFKQKKVLYVFAGIIFIASIMFKTSYQIMAIEKVLSSYMFYLVYIYPFFLYIIALLKNKRNKEGGE